MGAVKNALPTGSVGYAPKTAARTKAKPVPGDRPVFAADRRWRHRAVNIGLGLAGVLLLGANKQTSGSGSGPKSAPVGHVSPAGAATRGSSANGQGATPAPRGTGNGSPSGNAAARTTANGRGSSASAPSPSNGARGAPAVTPSGKEVPSAGGSSEEPGAAGEIGWGGAQGRATETPG